MEETTTSNTFSKGQVVPHEGDFVCVPCGYKHHFQPGETFTECISCLSGTKDGQHEDFLEGEEMWEPVVPVKPE